MKCLFLIILLLGHFSSITAQKTHENPKFLKPKGDPSCIYKPKYSVAQRNQLYPFKIADTVKLVSFRYHWHNYPVKDDTLVTDSLIEIKTLTKAEVNHLTDVLYNNFYKQQPNYGSLTQCFSPRNAILFMDKSGRIREHILICFHCNNSQTSSNEVTLGDACTEKMEKLRRFFITSQVVFGTNTTIDMYLGEESDEGIVLPPATRP